MKIVAISDVHVKYPHDQADKLLMDFFEHQETKSSQVILLLGDIFDLMCGPHRQYISQFSHIFTKMDELKNAGKEIYFFEGNHDIHLKKLFERIWPEGEISTFQYPLILDLAGKKYYVSHGDEHEVDNISYQKYKKFILSSPLRFIANHVMPLFVLDFFGKKASKKSRKKGIKIFDEEKVRERFRAGVTTTTAGKYDFVLGGHSHVQDLYQVSGSQEIYVNNGYALKTNTFIVIENHKVSFNPLT